MKDRSGFFDSDETHDPRAQRVFVVGTAVGAMFVLLLWAGVLVGTERPDTGSSQGLTPSEGRDDPTTLPIVPSTSPER